MTEPLITSSYIAVVTIGLIHGMEPGHGWPVAALLSTTAKRRYGYGAAAGAILSTAHFTSSLAVLAIYYASTTLLGDFLDFGSSWFKILTAAILLVLAFRFFREKEHVHGPHGAHINTKSEESGHEEAHKYGLEHNHFTSNPAGGRPTMGLKSLAGFAFVLGFAHEEEFMLFALFVGGVNPLVGMMSYGLAVTASLMTITLVAVKAFTMVETRIKKCQKYIPKVTGLVLTVLAILFLLPIFGGPNVY